jgi:hypothetical protein
VGDYLSFELKNVEYNGVKKLENDFVLYGLVPPKITKKFSKYITNFLSDFIT